MWNSKSCPEGVPHQKNGVMARKQAVASRKARVIGLVGNLRFTVCWCTARTLRFPVKRPLISRRDVACRVSAFQARRGTPRLYGKSILLHPKNSWKINRPETNGDRLSR